MATLIVYGVDTVSFLEKQHVEIGRRLQESVSPTRPHAGVESDTAHLLVGPFAAMVDRARDAISGKS